MEDFEDKLRNAIGEEQLKKNFEINVNPVEWLKDNLPELYFELTDIFDLSSFEKILVNHDVGHGESFFSVEFSPKKGSVHSFELISKEFEYLLQDSETVKESKCIKYLNIPFDKVLGRPFKIVLGVYEVTNYSKAEMMGMDLFLN